MAINLDNVKAITHNNKDVIKIEDSNGNVIWSKAPAGFNDLYYVGKIYSSYLNVEYSNKIDTQAGTSTPETYMSNVLPNAAYHTTYFTDGTKIYIIGPVYTKNTTTQNLNKLAVDQNFSYICFDYLPLTAPSNISIQPNEVFTDGVNIYTTYGDEIYKINLSAGTTTQVNYHLYNNGSALTKSGAISAQSFFVYNNELYVRASYTAGNQYTAIFKQRTVGTLQFDLVDGTVGTNLAPGYLFKWNNKYYQYNRTASSGHSIYDVDMTTFTRAATGRTVTGLNAGDLGERHIWTDGQKLYLSTKYQSRSTLKFNTYEFDPDTAVCTSSTMGTNPMWTPVCRDVSHNPSVYISGNETTWLMLT